MSLPKTVREVTALVEKSCPTIRLVFIDEIVPAVLVAAGIKLDADGVTLIYPSTTGTSTPRYQLEQRNVRFRGGRK